MWGGDGSWVYGGEHEDTTWAGGGGDTELGSHNPCQGTADVPDGITDRGRIAELPGQGLYGTSGDKDCKSGTFPSSAYPGYCVHFGGGKPTPPTVPPMKHAGTLSCSEREAP